ncbi:MAG: hypothetical protein EAX90_11940 [Candidatus Heimdallarchaeota archaeon]|nr:hypothetical protein [Candidatus Heimdallarchaeota archaeon]
MQKTAKIILIVIISSIIISGTSVGIWYAIKNNQEDITPHPDSDWKLLISGDLDGDDFNITLNEIIEMPSYKQDYTIRGSDTYIAEYEGASIQYLIQNEININSSATIITFVSNDSYELSFNIDELTSNEANILAYKKNGEYLKSQSEGGNGYLRLIIPPKNDQDYNGPLCLKWVVEIKFS